MNGMYLLTYVLVCLLTPVTAGNAVSAVQTSWFQLDLRLYDGVVISLVNVD